MAVNPARSHSLRKNPAKMSTIIEHKHLNGHSTHSIAHSNHSIASSIQSVQSAPNVYHKPEPSDASKLQSKCREEIASLRDAIEKIKEKHNHSILQEQAQSPNRPIPNMKRLQTLYFKVSKTFAPMTGKIYDADWSSDSTLLLSGSRDGYLTVWDRHSGSKKCTYQLPSASTWIQACSFSPNTSYIACGGLDNTLSIYRYESGDTLQSDDYKDQYQKSLKQINKTRSHTEVYKNGVSLLDQSSGGSSSGGGSPNGKYNSHHSSKSSRNLHPNGRHKSYSNVRGKGRHSRQRSVPKISEVDGHLIIKDRPHRTLHHHQGYLSSVQFQHDQKVITASGDQTCILWDVVKKVPDNVFLDHSGDVTSLAISRGSDGGNIFISGSVDATVKMWDIRMSKCVGEFVSEDGDSDVNAVCWFPDYNAFASGSDDGELRMFDIRAYKQLNEYFNDDIASAVTSCCFSKSGRVLFAGYDDDPYGKAWDVAFAEPTGELGHDEHVSAVKVAPNGGSILTASWDKKLRLWTPTMQASGKRKARRSTEAPQ